MGHTFLAMFLGWFALVYGQKVCDVTKEPGIQRLDIRLPIMPIPAQRTFYICQQFKVPEDAVYHAVAFQALINNRHVMHHMLLFGCEEELQLKGPHHCVGEDANCKSWLTVWTIGRKGQICTHQDTGVRFGKRSFKYFALQIHWNNPELANNLTDNSGMRIFYTRNLRQYDVGNVQIGQNDLEIPPLSQDVKQSGSCSSSCTRRLLPHPVYLTRTYLHMHGLGAAGSMDLYREGQHVQQIAFDADYQYHLSPVHIHDAPVQVKPGDEIRVSCWFDSSSEAKRRNETVYFGEGSDVSYCHE